MRANRLRNRAVGHAQGAECITQVSRRARNAAPS